MKAALFLSALASAAVGVVAEELKIDVTLPVVCERKTQKGDKVQMHYRGTLKASGEQFDASYDRGTPLSFQVGSGQVIRGWDEGLLDMCIGEKRLLTIPPEYGYGNRAIGPIPAGSTLVFETELVGIAGVPKPEKIETKVVEGAESAAEAISKATESAAEATEKVAGKVAQAVADAAAAAATIIADTDDAPEHEEL
ncbi:FK506-binding protein 2 [Fusarium tricinctum]|uniref:peptidylprolyl isomerase n=1 Tax=Fusarium tricinctum TaxID=61284 RepID=A0A8K0WH76_9HYPO|nr:FK506-binding protein 2 [Fusarium tricinctum]